MVVIWVVPNNSVNVETTLSFAIKPAIKLVTILQSANPWSLKIGAIIFAILARMLSPVLSFSRYVNVKSNLQ